MSDLREDPLTGRRVLIAENRSGRPNEFAAPVEPPLTDKSPRADCAFCAGNEAQTPDPTFQVCDSDGWYVRAFPNKYPAIDVTAGQGQHEVIVESRSHIERTGDCTVENVASALFAYSQRLHAMALAFDYQLLFKNVGASAGASLRHLHSQVLALDEVPSAIVAERERLESHRRETGDCGWCEYFDREQSLGHRIVAITDRFLAVCPYASRQPFETWIVPVEHASYFPGSAESMMHSQTLAKFILPVVRAIEAEIGTSGYNMILATAPAGSKDWHWRLEIVPRVASLAGLELATGLFMNVVSPERAAERLRQRIAATRAEST